MISNEQGRGRYGLLLTHQCDKPCHLHIGRGHTVFLSKNPKNYVEYFSGAFLFWLSVCWVYVTNQIQIKSMFIVLGETIHMYIVFLCNTFTASVRIFSWKNINVPLCIWTMSSMLGNIVSIEKSCERAWTNRDQMDRIFVVVYQKICCNMILLKCFFIYLFPILVTRFVAAFCLRNPYIMLM